MNPRNNDRKGNPQNSRPEDRPHIGDQPANPNRQAGKTSEQGPQEKPKGPDVPDYGDQEKSDPRRINIEADVGEKRARGRTGSEESPTAGDGPVQSNESPSM
jgi:hypothetical protein